MNSLRAEGVRFVAVGAFITVLYLSVTTVMRVVLDAPWWLAIAVGYVIATSTHFILHRTVTFAKDEFQLSTAQQAVRFIAVVVCQYAFTATAMAVLPSTLITFFCVAAFVTVVSFFLLRTRLFH